MYHQHIVERKRLYKKEYPFLYNLPYAVTPFITLDTTQTARIVFL